MTASDRFLPPVLNRSGVPVYRVAGDRDDCLDCDVILSLDPPFIGRAEDAALCLATGDGKYAPPHVTTGPGAYCERLAFHDGPHAYRLGHLVDTFAECRCEESRHGPASCWHRGAVDVGHPHISASLVLYVAPVAEPMAAEVLIG